MTLIKKLAEWIDKEIEEIEELPNNLQWSELYEEKKAILVTFKSKLIDLAKKDLEEDEKGMIEIEDYLDDLDSLVKQNS